MSKGKIGVDKYLWMPFVAAIAAVVVVIIMKATGIFLPILIGCWIIGGGIILTLLIKLLISNIRKKGEVK